MSQYQQNPNQPPPYSQQPAHQAPKQKHAGRNALLVSVGAATLATATIVAVAAGGADKVPQQSSGAAHQVWYRADGVGTTEASYTLRSDNGGTVQGDINLPLVNKAGETGLTFTRFGSGDFVYLSVQNASGSGSVTCRIFVDGVEISSNTSDGAYKIASCSSRVP